MTTFLSRLLAVFVSPSVFLFVFLASVQANAQTLDRIVAVANDDVVTQQQVSARIDAVKQQYKNNPSVLPSDAILTKQVLDALIIESLQLQLAKRANLVIPERQIDEAINTIARRQNLSVSEFLARVQASGQNISQLREQLRSEITINELQRSRIGRQIFVSEAEVDRFLRTQSGQTLTDTQYTLSYQRFESSDRKLAEERLAQVNEGAPLLDFEGARSLGSRALVDIPSIFKTIVPVLNLNEAALVENNGALHLVQLVAKTEQQTVNVKEYKIRHILISSNALFDKESAFRLISDLKTQIENGASMASLADEYSEDDGSKGLGGDLGWNSLDSFVPPFADAARNLSVGQLSNVIETTFGYHILRVEEIRTRDVGLDVLRNQIKNQLAQARFNESLQIWLTELRAESYVELRN